MYALLDIDKSESFTMAALGLVTLPLDFSLTIADTELLLIDDVSVSELLLPEIIVNLLALIVDRFAVVAVNTFALRLAGRSI